MSDNVQNKRSYTVAILLIIVVVLMTFIIIFYSKYLLTKQSHTTDQGQRLAERYVYALIFAERLRDGSDGLLNAKSETERLRAARMLGEATLASGETLGLILAATERSTGKSGEEEAKPFISAMNAVIGAKSPMATIGEQEGPLTEEESAALNLVRDGAAQMRQALSGFRPPSGEAGYRQMVTIGDWVTNAVDASDALIQLAGKLQ
ncbi:hypothetical protein [Cohnella luojiensis]|uniref:Uncharacterized protein n=1 Tax=Cohnella luojiensis TaxID=652876 RepID=A0A4Y8MB67_9BACL|nr:hypothetical protein [Cohnella luojiensis]TFE31667.1 hypothetical protein E2980_00890 [Cohnella luojiensis]